jgi:hypothetical protein
MDKEKLKEFEEAEELGCEQEWDRENKQCIMSDGRVVPTWAWNEESPPFYWRDYGLVDDQLYEVPKYFCPICSMTYLVPKDIVKYLLMSRDIHLDDIEAEIRETFGTQQALQEFLKGEKKDEDS